MPTPYEPVSVYDAPGVIFSSLLDGELTGETFRSALMDPMSLTPAERDTIQTRLKQASGDHAISNALIDVATNPWAWFAFITSPVATSALARAGKGIFDVAAEATVFHRRMGSMLSILGATSPLQDLGGSSLGSTLHQVGKGFYELAQEEGAALGQQRAAMLKRTGLDMLEWEKVYNPQKRELARRLNATVFAKLAGWDKEWDETIGYVNEEGKAATRLVPHAQKVTADLDSVLRELGGQEAVDYTQAVAGAMKQRIGRVFADDDAIMRVYRLISNPAVQAHTEQGATTGKDIIKLVMGDMFEQVEAGRVDPEEFKKFVGEVVRAPLKNENYVPKNIWETWVGERQAQTRMNPQALSTIKPGGYAINREFRTALYRPDDAQYIHELLGGTDALDDEIQKAIAVKETNEPARFMRTDIDRSVARYMDDTARTYAFTQKPSAELLEAQAMSRTKLEELAKSGGGQTLFPTLPEAYDKPLMDGGRPASTRRAMKDVLPGEQPAGGFSVADALWGDYIYMADKQARERLTSIWMPMATGRLPAKGAALMAATEKVKEWTRALVQTDAVKQAAESEKGSEWLGTLENWAKSPPRTAEGAVTSRVLSNWLYASHLGGNMGSVVLNLTQPFLLASTWLGAGNVMKAYGTSLKEMTGYMGARAEQGFRDLSEAEKLGMFRQHFSLADVDGDNLLGVGPKLMETIEGATLSGARSQYGQGGFGGRAMAWMMKPFETAEILNRLVAGHATLEAYKGAGRAVMDGAGKVLPEVAADVRRAVQETQFGGTFLNTPTMFQTGWLANPLLRQFMSFQLRSFTGLAETSRRIGGRTGWGGAMGPLYDFGRAMGISSVLYEAGKNLVHADVSRGLAFSAATDILPGFAGGRFDDRDSLLPVPPIVDIPYNMFVAAASGDMELMKRQLPRVIPGGVALSRVLGGAPQVPLPDPFNMQTTYVGWNKMQTGPNGERLVPTFKGDGTLIDWQNPSAIVLRAMGADLGGRTATLDVDRWLMKQGDVIRQYRQEALSALMAGNTDKFNGVRDEFRRRTGLPLTISQAHLADAVKQREVPRYERVLGRIPQDLRGSYQETLQGQAAYRSGIEGLPGSKGLERPTATGVTAGQAGAAMQQGQSQDAQTGSGQKGYEGFEGY